MQGVILQQGTIQQGANDILRGLIIQQGARQKKEKAQALKTMGFFKIQHQKS